MIIKVSKLKSPNENPVLFKKSKGSGDAPRLIGDPIRCGFTAAA